MTIVMPDGVPTLGTTRLKASPICSSQAAPSLATDINATGAVELAGLIYPAGWGPAGTANKGTKPARLASKSTAEQFNRTAWTVADLQYVHDPQGLSSDAINAARTALLQGLKFYFFERIGLDANVAFAASQKIRTHYLTLGPQIWSGDRTDENGEFFITQSVIYVSSAGPVDGVIAA